MANNHCKFKKNCYNTTGKTLSQIWILILCATMIKQERQHQLIYWCQLTHYHWTYCIGTLALPVKYFSYDSEINFCTSHSSTMSPQKSEAAIWQSFFFSCCSKPAKAALLTGSLAESGLATKDVFHPQWLRRYLQEAATFPYLAPDKALCHSTVYHYQSQRIQGSFPLKWRAVWDAVLHIYSNTELRTTPVNEILTWNIFRFRIRRRNGVLFCNKTFISLRNSIPVTIFLV